MLKFVKSHLAAFMLGIVLTGLLSISIGSRVAHAWSPNDGLSPAGSAQFVFNSHAATPVSTVLGNMAIDTCVTLPTLTAPGALAGDTCDVAYATSGASTLLSARCAVTATSTITARVCNVNQTAGYNSATATSWAANTFPHNLSE